MVNKKEKKLKNKISKLKSNEEIKLVIIVMLVILLIVIFFDFKSSTNDLKERVFYLENENSNLEKNFINLKNKYGILESQKNLNVDSWTNRKFKSGERFYCDSDFLDFSNKNYIDLNKEYNDLVDKYNSLKSK
jgi:hypothetical protein